ncbi:MAG: ribonuclease P protein component [Clostridia bacterium]|nr:ribonuclease P protein component [Clostridia bacterium]
MKHIAIGENHLYSKAYTKGEKFVSKSVIVYVLKDFKARKLQNAHPQKLMVNRIGLTVSKKLGKAVIRSRVKRVLREGLRQIEKTDTLKTGYLIVLVARPLCTEIKSQEVAKDLRKAFIKLGLINNQENEQN